MRYLEAVCLLIGAIAWAQNQPAAPAAKRLDGGQMRPSSASDTAPETPVLTIHGLCTERKPTAMHSAKCQTVITRAQFERLVDAIQPEMDVQTKGQLARSYPEFLEMAREAKRRGLDKQPRFIERLAFARMQILSQELIREINAEAARVPEKDIEDYYRKNTAEFEEASLERIVLPLRREHDQQPGEEGPETGKQNEDDMRKQAEILRVRAAAGEDFAKLQKEAYEVAGISGNTEPNPRMGEMKRRGLPPAHASVFNLGVGQVSAVISDGTGYYIYKLDSRGIEPLDAVKEEISNRLRRQRAQQMIESIEHPFTTDVNSAYFKAGAKEADD
ncbi:MAG: peptidylprolyl isomerase [Terriglobales bacterium]